MTEIICRSRVHIFKLCCLEFFFCSYLGAYYSFLFIFLQSKGINSATIGLILAINALISIFSQPFWGIVSDKFQNVKAIFIFCIIAATLLYQLLPFCSSSWMIGLLFAAINFFYSPLLPLVDNWIIQNVSTEKNIGYGHVRLWGCIGFAVTTYILGKYIVLNSINIIFPAFAILALITIAFCFSIKNEKPVINLAFKNLKIGMLLKNYDYITFLIYATLFSIPIISCETFFTPLFLSLGGNEEKLGLAFAVCALSEVPIFFVSTYILKKFKHLNLILLASLFYILRQWLYIIATKTVHLILVQTLQGVCFGIFLSSALYYVDSMSPIELKATSQTIFGALYYGITGISGNFLGGIVTENFGLVSMFKVSFIVSASVFVLFVVSLVLRGGYINKHRESIEST